MTRLIAEDEYDVEINDENEKNNDHNLVLILVLEKQDSTIPAIIYGGRERGQMINGNIG
jgi:hypothetical protein